jgi:hypothetical protein
MLKDLYIFYVKYFPCLLWNVCPMNFYLYRHENLTLQNVWYTCDSEIVAFMYVKKRYRGSTVSRIQRNKLVSPLNALLPLFNVFTKHNRSSSINLLQHLKRHVEIKRCSL